MYNIPWGLPILTIVMDFMSYVISPDLFGMPLRPLGDRKKMVGFEIHQEAIGDLVGGPRKDAEIVKICEDEPGTNGRFASQHVIAMENHHF